MSEWRYVEQFGAIDPTKPFRILPVGKFKRFGRKVEVTPEMVQEMAANFGVIPETALPVNAEHKSEAGKVGNVQSVEARPDGLYAVLSWLEDGLAAVSAGKFQYFSPEVYWGPTDYDGRTASNVLMGLAVTNSPYFGQATALYTLEDGAEEYRDFSPEQRRQLAQEGKAMPDGSYPIVTEADLSNAIQAWGRSPDEATKRHIIKRAKALGRADMLPADWPGSTKESNMSVVDEIRTVFSEFGIKPQTPPAPVPVTETEEYKLADKRAREAEERLAKAEADRKLAADVQKFSTALTVQGFTLPDGLAQKFAAVAAVDETLADGLVTEFKALVEQARVGELFAELGTSAPGGSHNSDAEKFVSRAEQVAKDKGIPVTDAYAIITKEEPELYKAYVEDQRSRKNRD